MVAGPPARVYHHPKAFLNLLTPTVLTLPSGTLYVSFVVFHRLYHKGWDGEIPYVVGVIELKEGARMLSNVIGVPVENVKCDMPVEVVFDDVTEKLTLPKFKPV